MLLEREGSTTAFAVISRCKHVDEDGRPMRT